MTNAGTVEPDPIHCSLPEPGSAQSVIYYMEYFLVLRGGKGGTHRHEGGTDINVYERKSEKEQGMSRNKDNREPSKER